MLDVPTTKTGSGKRRTASTQIRHDDALARKIEAASRYLGLDKSAFLRAVIDREASRVIEAQTRHVMTAEDAARFAAALDAKPEPTPRALKAAQAYRHRVTHAD